MGYDIDLSPEDGSARVTLDLEPRHLNRNGTLHGGIIAMLLDTSAGFAAARRPGQAELAKLVTVTLTTQYLAPARQGQVVATGRQTGGGISLIYATSELRDTRGRLLASATGVFKRLKRKDTP